ncbi:MAG: ferritin-like domain-containing protein [Microthrixaceae bacterium]|nr:ferritin-like domain-containing protein [Microthrixaceae bacterium]MCB1011838.1 ferritin-like domain-containing protein [Microthrixaceae bacterium]MCO5322585.1 ferritin-like domain-containing protein [Microthrixaceae bacterium]
MTIQEDRTAATVDGAGSDPTTEALHDSSLRWDVPTPTTTVFDWDYTNGRDHLLRLYDKGTRKQWVSSDRIDWDHEIDPMNPLGVPDDVIPIADAPIWQRLSEEQKGEVRHHMVAWQFSQFMHGEQGALVCSSKIVNTVPQIDSKFYAATQVVDEARHVETYSRFLHEKVKLTYPLNPNLKVLLDQGLSDSRWDFTYLAMQVLIEGLALAAFGTIRMLATDPLAKAVNTYVMQDEARHVMFGRLALRDYYPELTDAERDEREEFVVEACYRMRDRFLAEELWERLGLPASETLEHVKTSETQIMFRGLLFQRIVPVLRDIGLFGDKVRAAFTDMGVMGYQDTDVEELMAEDEAMAEELDRQRAEAHVEGVAAAGDQA